MDQSETMIDQTGAKKVIRLKRRNSGGRGNKSMNETVRSSKKAPQAKEAVRTDPEQTQKLKAEYEALMQLDIEEIEKRIEKVDRDIKAFEMQKVQVMRNKAPSKRMQILQLRDLDEAIHF